MRCMLTLIFLVVTAWGCTQNHSEPLQNLSIGVVAAPPQSMTLKIQNYKPQAGNTFQNIFVFNHSTQVRYGVLSLSTSRGGMIDTLKQQLQPTFGFQVSQPESVVFGFSDLALFYLGIDSTQQKLMSCATNLSNPTITVKTSELMYYADARYPNISTPTYIGLRDCAKIQLGLDKYKFDFDGDGIPDYLELVCGLNPQDPTDAVISTAGDGITNLEKCRNHIPINESASTQPNKLYAYVYTQEQNQDSSINFSVSNVGILNNGEENFVAVYITEKNIATGVEQIFTAYTILTSPYDGKTLNVDYNMWLGAGSNNVRLAP